MGAVEIELTRNASWIVDGADIIGSVVFAST